MAYPLLYLLFFVFPFHTFAQNNPTFAVNQTLTADTASQPWVSSPSGVFAFGFHKLQATEDQFMLCIWYANIPQRTIVWHANTSAVPQGSTVRVDAGSGLILSDPQGNKLWSPGGLGQVIDHGFLNDTGNLVLVGRDSTVVWDTFSHPTDTLLPTQEMKVGGMLISRRSESDFSQGRFYLRMLGDGNMILSTKSVSTNSDFDDDYYNSRTSSDPTTSDYKLMFSEMGSLYILKGSNETVEITQPRSIYSGSYLRLSLNFDGVLSLYNTPKISTVNPTWVSSWSQPENICTAINGNYGSGACGYNNVCSLDDDNTKRPSCKCPRGYSLLDPSDEYGSCGTNFVQTCDEPLGTKKGSSQDLYEIIEVNNTNWPFNDIEHINPCGEDECKASCLNDCLCDVAIYGGAGCWKKRLPLSNGAHGPNIASKAFIKLRKNGFQEKQNGFPEKKKDHGTLIVVGSVLLGSSVFINFLFITTACLGFSFIYKRKIKKPNPPVQSNLHCFSYNELAKATNGFREEIGRGASAIVYKGEIPLGSGNIVAVKKLDRVAHDSEKEFKAEVNVIGQTHHKHLVRLLGYCNEAQGQHQLLVYEYMRNGSVASFLFKDLTPSWSERTKIALGIAHGLTYLHEECNTQIIHCDIKPQNILLDENYNARISDFGLAKLLRVNESRTHTNIRGTKGYVAPEWFRNNKVTVKVDVYSFGILLMEIITGRKCVGDIEIDGSDKVILADWVIDCFQEKRLDLLVENDAEALNDMEMVGQFVMTAIWCIQEDPSLRPTMRKVNQMLEGVVQVPVPPYPYSFT